MNFKVDFVSGHWRDVTADLYTVDDELLVFVKDEKPVLSCVLGNVSCWGEVEATADQPFKLR